MSVTLGQSNICADSPSNIKDEGLIKIALSAGNCDTFLFVLGVDGLEFDIFCPARPGLENRPLKGQRKEL